jgi:hypothetical protein
LVDARDSKSRGPCARVGSIPTSGTILKYPFFRPDLAYLSRICYRLRYTSINTDIRIFSGDTPNHYLVDLHAIPEAASLIFQTRRE